MIAAGETLVVFFNGHGRDVGQNIRHGSMMTGRVGRNDLQLHFGASNIRTGAGLYNQQLGRHPSHSHESTRLIRAFRFTPGF
jgi:hypothetical protein